MVRSSLLVLLALTMAVPGLARAEEARAEEARGAGPAVCVAPLGRYERAMVPVVVRGIEHLYGLEVRVLSARPLPREAYYAPRKRYRAEKLLAFLDREVVPASGCDLVVGFTAVDISTTKDRHVDWGVLGLAWIGGPSGVVSTYRLRRKVSWRQRAMRTVKVFNHELVHALGLDHHDVTGCLMEDAGGTVRTVDRESGLLCDQSRQEIEERRGFPVPDRASFDWRRVLR